MIERGVDSGGRPSGLCREFMWLCFRMGVIGICYWRTGMGNTAWFDTWICKALFCQPWGTQKELWCCILSRLGGIMFDSSAAKPEK